MYWDSTGDWRLKYYTELHQRDDEDLSMVEKSERDLDRLEYQATAGLLKNIDINEVLDIGCGVGRQITYFASVYPQKNFTGVDVSSYQIKLLQNMIQEKQLSNVVAKHMDAAQIGTLNKQFDLITFYNNAFGCLSAEQQKKCLSDLLKIISPQGYLLFGCFDRIDLAEMCYREWGLSIKSIDNKCGLIDLGSYKSCWKTEELLFSALEGSFFRCCSKQIGGLGSVYAFQNNR